MGVFFLNTVYSSLHSNMRHEFSLQSSVGVHEQNVAMIQVFRGFLNYHFDVPLWICHDHESLICALSLDYQSTRNPAVAETVQRYDSIIIIIIIIIVFIENCQNAVSYNKRNNKRMH